MPSICRFVPDKIQGYEIKTIHFVYETELKKLRQPFCRPLYTVHLAVKGEGMLLCGGCEYRLMPNALFFSFPGEKYEIKAEDDFEYIYISFAGQGASELLDKFGITRESAVYYEYSYSDLWSDSIRKINSENANVLTESILFHTLSMVQCEYPHAMTKNNRQSLIQQLTDYTDVHFKDAEISLTKLSEKFCYTEKYISSYFKKHMGIKFTEYLNTLRVQHGAALMNGGKLTVSEIAYACGFTNTLYFSRVFKKYMGLSPSEYISLKDNNQ